MKGNICDYFEECLIAKASGRDCADYDNCQIRKFYDRYGLDYLSFGVGAMMIPTGLEADVVSQKSHNR